MLIYIKIKWMHYYWQIILIWSILIISRSFYSFLKFGPCPNISIIKIELHQHVKCMGYDSTDVNVFQYSKLSFYRLFVSLITTDRVRYMHLFVDKWRQKRVRIYVVSVSKNTLEMSNPKFTVSLQNIPLNLCRRSVR